MTDYSWIFEFNDNIHLLVIAGGIAHIINPNLEKPKSSFGGGIDFCQKEQSGKFILSDGIKLTIVESNTDYWNTDRISWME